MKITDRLMGDHKTFRKMLADLDKIAGQPVQDQNRQQLIRLVELFKDHLMLHAWFEDKFYYPAIRKNLAKAPLPLSVSYMDSLDDEHKAVDGTLDRLENEVKAQPSIITWPQTYALFLKGLASHMEKEEEELFPLSEKFLGAKQLEDLSLEMERHRSEAPKVRFHAQA